ncbi:hypothetical protein [Sinorhizobium medicae]|uniref:hypothetical protein n=1 Tax=Sinorhizobium medicae TaxID=110321 RepID=UPI001F1B4FC5|nr:hypothetical protein [Sinorhizobium medicae]WQP39112.1 hypothetical protein U8C38_05815 [Sinorhizobium medicae]
MKRLVLQHYTGALGEVEQRSMLSIRELARREGADYQFLSGNVFSEKLTPPMQKLALLDPCFDDYDVVAMLDMDVFIRSGMQESLFEQLGIGVSGPSQRRLKWAFVRKMKGLVHWRYPYWCGSLWKLDRPQRQAFWSKLPLVNLERYNNGRLEDEGVMHQLARHCRFTGGVLPGGDKWSRPSWRDDLEGAALIHVRPRISKAGGKRPKLENLSDLIRRGLIDG